jgi:tRNA (guanine-N7-)-methyltransferase
LAGQRCYNALWSIFLTTSSLVSQDYPIRTQQRELSARIYRHQGDCSYQRPIPPHQWSIWQSLQRLWCGDQRPLVLDSGCGRGMSTRHLQQRYPGCRVLGMDQSLSRLQATQAVELAENIWCDKDGGPWWVRVNVIDFWRIMRQQQVSAVFHALWYPNPWPKARHAKRRFHAHPVFADCLAISQCLEMRTQWRLYADEFMASARFQGHDAELGRVDVSEKNSHFEQKYQQNALPLWWVRVMTAGHGCVVSARLKD